MLQNKTCYFLVDLETTGVRFLNDKIFEVGLIVFDGETILDKYDTGIRIDDALIEAAQHELAGIIRVDADKIRQSPPADEVFKRIIEIIKKYKDEYDEVYFVAHNASFDYNMLLSNSRYNPEYHNYIKEVFENHIIDTVERSKAVFSELQKHSLNYIAQYIIKNKIGEYEKLDSMLKERCAEGHSAFLDTLMLLEVFKVMLSMNPFLM